MYKIYEVTVLLLALTVTVVLSSSCGSGPKQNWWAGLALKLDCPSRLGRFNACCDTHDSCYDRQAGRANCDETFCGCVKQAGKGTLCQVDAWAFCKLVKAKGKTAYDNAGRKG